jgi:anti-sigma B factor antagonist
MSAAIELRGQTILVTGELDFDAAPSIQASIEELAKQTPGTLVLDLSGVHFIDSIGLQTLLNLQRSLALDVGSVSHPVRRLIEMVGLEPFVLTSSSRDDATPRIIDVSAKSRDE